MDLQRVKDYLRIDYEDDDLMIMGFISAAKEYLSNAGVPERSQSELYNIVILMLVALFYENRDVSDKDVKIPTVIMNFIVQLSCKREVAP
ncbi:MAG: head-tail connector protein [Paenibacillus sp.]|uniref:head-tail connector protein n=1 Tax=Paenibacillus sp. TaxID=58172 RepID=UPI00291416E6|nr:head-tail connector protein [Paenibacillus sp.]MDU4696397.1 head-tail connector protein [Paenibacillus sp.]